MYHKVDGQTFFRNPLFGSYLKKVWLEQYYAYTLRNLNHDLNRWPLRPTYLQLASEANIFAAGL